MNAAAPNPAQTKQQGKSVKMVPLRLVVMPFAIILVSIVIFIAFAAMAPKPEKLPVTVKAPVVDVLELQSATVNFSITSQGTVAPRTETTLISEVSGQIKRVSDKFVVGGYFEKGELLLEIDPISYEVALLQAQARLDAAGARLVEEQARSKQSEHEWRMTGKPLDEAPVLALRKPMLQQAQADVSAARADVKGANIKLARTKITAPYDAMIKQKVADIGQYVSTGSQLAVTFAVDYAEVRLPIKAKDLPYIKVPNADEATASSVTLTNTITRQHYSWETAISRSEGVVDSKSRVNYLIVAIDDPYNIHHKNDRPQLHMGSFVNATISAVTLDNIFTVPRSALRGNGSIYLMNDDNQLQLQDVEVFHADRDNVYIRTGLVNGQRLIVTNIHTPVQGMDLRVQGQETETADTPSNTIAVESSEQENNAAGVAQ